MKSGNFEWGGLLRIVAIGALCVFIYKLGAGFPPSNLKGKVAPAFDLQTDTELVHSQALRGRAVMLEFWAPWCGACHSSFDMVNQIAQTFSEEDVFFLGVNVETSPRYANMESQLAIPSGIDRDGSIATSFDVSVLPTFVIIDRKGNVSEVISGVPSRDELQQSIKNAL